MDWELIVSSLIGSGSGGLIGYILGKRKRDAEAEGLMIANAKEIIEKWKELRKEDETRYEELKKDYDLLKEKVDVLEQELHKEKEARKRVEHEKNILERQIEEIRKNAAN